VETINTGGMAEETDDMNEGRRQIVLHPRTAAARRVDRTRSFGSHVRGYTVQTEDVFSLVDEQRRTSIRYLISLLTPVLVVLLSFVVWPELTDWDLRGIPAPWLLLGPVALFSIVLIAWRHDRKALATERRWAENHEQSDQ